MATEARYEFKKGMFVRWVIDHGFGVSSGYGRIVKLPPKNPGRGTNRLTVIDEDGKKRMPYTSRCRPARSTFKGGTIPLK